MSQATNDLWRNPPDLLGTLRDLGTVDISPTVRVDAAGDEKQTPTIVLTLGLDDASDIAFMLDHAEGWPAIVTEIRKALGLAGAWVEFQDGTL